MRPIIACASCTRAYASPSYAARRSALHTSRVVRNQEDTKQQPVEEEYTSTHSAAPLSEGWEKLFAETSPQVDSTSLHTRKPRVHKTPSPSSPPSTSLRSTLDSVAPSSYGTDRNDAYRPRRRYAHDRNARLTVPEMEIFERILEVTDSKNQFGAGSSSRREGQDSVGLDEWKSALGMPSTSVASGWSADVERVASSDVDGTLGSSFSRAASLDIFRKRVQSSARTGRERSAQRRLNTRLGLGNTDRTTAAVIMEGLAAKVTPEDMARTMDEARQELEMCENEAQVWRWAASEVWGQPQGEEAQEASASSEPTTRFSDSTVESTSTTEEEALTDDSPSPNSPTNPKYGLLTAFYAPVLHLLFTHLRDRFHSPHSALSVLRISRQLGPSSLVLGGTAALYAEAVRTRWNILADAGGVLETLREAREAGVLLSGPEAPVSRARRFGARDEDADAPDGTTAPRRPKAEDEPIRLAIDAVRTELRARAIQDQKLAGAHVVHLDEDTARRAQRGSLAMDLAPIAATSLSDELLRVSEELKRLAGTSARQGGREGFGEWEGGEERRGRGRGWDRSDRRELRL